MSARDIAVMRYAQDRYETPPDGYCDPIADAINDALTDLQIAQRAYASMRDPEDIGKVLARMREVAAMLAEVAK